MAHPVIADVFVAAASSNSIATTQPLPGANGLAVTLGGSLVVGSVAILPHPGRILITSAGNDSGITFTVTGTSRPHTNGGGVQVETITGGNATGAATTQDFATVTGIVASGPTASTITVGTNGIASTPWVVYSQYAQDFQVSLVGYIISGTPTWGVEYTYDDVFGLFMPKPPTVVLFPRPIAMATMPLTNTNSPLDGFLTQPVRAARVTMNGTGQVNFVSIQQGS